MSEPFHNGMTIGEAREKLRELVDDGHRCPVCTQFAKVYRRKIHAAMALALIDFYKRNGLSWAEWPTRQSDEAKLRYWSLIEEEALGTKGATRWRITGTGYSWLLGHIRVPKYARIFDSRCLGFTGERVSIREALGTKFDYDELMRGI